MKRPAETGFNPARLSPTQSFAAIVSKRKAWPACGPAATAARSRIADSSGGARKCTVIRQLPCPLSTRLTAISSAAKLSANKSATRRADCSSVISVANAVSAATLMVSEFIERSALLKILHAIHKRQLRTPYSHGRKIIHIAINILFMAFPQQLPQYFHGIPAASGRIVNGASRCRSSLEALSARRTVFIMRVNHWTCPGERNDRDLCTSSIHRG